MENRKALLLAELRRDVRDQRVLDAMARVSREAFVPDEVREMAYEDIALPIGAEQTISQPFIVAIMSEALELTGDETVLEIGTGSGYQAAVLSELARRVVSVERIPSLAETSSARLAALGYTNVTVCLAMKEGLGWPAEAPYDAIIVTAAAPQVPPSLVSQLRDGGRMVVPVGSRFEQELLQVHRRGNQLQRRLITYCRFVPLLGADGWPTAADAQT